MDLKYSVGLDVSSKKINGCISLIDNNQKVTVKSSIVFNNDLKGFKSFEDWMIKHRRELEIPLVICMEATGIYHENCALYLFERNYRVSIILPNKAKKYLEAIGLKSKNDSIDAKGLSQMGAEQCLEQWEPFGKYFYELRLYTRQNQNLQELKTVISSQLHALKQAMYTNQIVIEQLESTIVLFDLQLKELEKIGKLRILTDDVIGKVESYSFPEGEFNMVMPPLSKNGYAYGIDNMKLEEAKAKLSKSEKKKFEKLAKERSEIAKKQAELEKKQAEVAKKQAEERKELAKKQAEIARQQAEITGVKGKVFYYGTSAFSENANDAAKNFTKIKWSNSDALNNKNIKIYIDGKLVDKAEVEKLNPNDISSISVNKSKNNGAEDGEIKIETKK